jgi:hypothetical protein
MAAALHLMSGCGAVIGGMIAKRQAEDITSHKYVLSVEQAEGGVRAAYKSLAISLNERKTSGDTVVLVGRDPEDVKVETTIAPLKNGVVKVSCTCGGAVYTSGKDARLQQEVMGAIAHKLQGHELGA